MPRILIVEDEFLIRLTLSEALIDDGFNVIEAGSGDEALSIFDDGDDFALLLTDVQLPGAIDGLGLARMLRQRDPEIPIIYMSGRHDAVRRDALGRHDAFIAKPYLPSEVCAAARRLTGLASH